jgi:hypothetical protein
MEKSIILKHDLNSFRCIVKHTEKPVNPTVKEVLTKKYFPATVFIQRFYR